MYHLLFGGVRVAVRNGKWWLYEVSGGCVEISPNVRKSAELRAISKVSAFHLLLMHNLTINLKINGQGGAGGW